MLCSIQDGGRVGFRHLAIPRSGFLDADSARLANFLVDNEFNTPTLEIIGSFQFTVLSDLQLGISGAEVQVERNSQPIEYHKTIEAHTGDTFNIKGHVSYLAVPDGIQQGRNHFDSVSTYPMAKLGGLDGEYLKKGIILKAASRKVTQRLLPSEIIPKRDGHFRVLKGPEFQEPMEEFSNLSCKVSADSNRVGIKLTGHNWESAREEMKPVPVFPGTIQLTSSGQPIVLLADGQTTGGYPRIGQVIEADLPRLGRMITRGSIKFTFVEINEAKDILHRKIAFIKHALEKSI